MIGAITSAVGRAIFSEFGSDYAVYEEEVKQGIATPCFFIACENPSERQFFGSRYFTENRFCITFFPSDGSGKNRECGEAAQRLAQCLEWIELEGRVIMGRRMSYTLKDGVLSFFVNYDMFVYKKEEKTLMGELDKRIGLWRRGRRF